jgi:hypothetical protein
MDFKDWLSDRPNERQRKRSSVFGKGGRCTWSWLAIQTTVSAPQNLSYPKPGLVACLPQARMHVKVGCKADLKNMVGTNLSF